MHRECRVEFDILVDIFSWNFVELDIFFDWLFAYIHLNKICYFEVNCDLLMKKARMEMNILTAHEKKVVYQTRNMRAGFICGVKIAC